MTWLRKNDLDYDDPLVRAAGNAAYGAFVRMELFASAQRTNGWIPEDKARELVDSRAELRALLDTRIEDEDLGPLLHRQGAECSCLERHEWSAERGGYWIHDFLRFNPSRAENDVHRAKKRELRDPKLKYAVRQRDDDRCRYCGKHCKYTDRVSDDGLTFDHPDPERADGANNLVVACRGCNNRKNRRTPEQAGMVLLDLPTTAPVTEPATVASQDTSPDTGPVTSPAASPDPTPSGGLSPDLQQDATPPQVSTSPGRDGAGSAPGIGPPDTTREPGQNGNPYLRQKPPHAGNPPHCGESDPGMAAAAARIPDAVPRRGSSQGQPGKRSRRREALPACDTCGADETTPRGERSIDLPGGGVRWCECRDGGGSRAP